MGVVLTALPLIAVILLGVAAWLLLRHFGKIRRR